MIKKKKWEMKKWTGGVVILILGFILVVSYTFIGKSESPAKQSAYDFFHPNSDENGGEKSKSSEANSAKLQLNITATRSKPQFRYVEGLDDLYSLIDNDTVKHHSEVFRASTHMRSLFPRSDSLPETAQGIKEAVAMLKDLLLMIENDGDEASKKGDNVDESCPRFVKSPLNGTTLTKNDGSIDIPCGLVEDSSVTVIGVPDSKQSSFQIELIGSQLKDEEIEPPIVFQYNVSLPGENLTMEPLISQNSWTRETGWGKEEKCPDNGSSEMQIVGGLVKCNAQIARKAAEDKRNQSQTERSSHSSTAIHFVEGNPFTATVWAGNEGFHMTVNGRHETSFQYRKRLEPWLVNKVKVKGGVTIVSLLAKGLPVAEEVELVPDVQQLKAPSLSKKRLTLLIGVFSIGNNFERRMALRRTWMQYEPIRSGNVAVRFLIGLHKNKEVNFKLWREAETYGDIQLMPFVDYYSLLTYKTIAIFTMGTKILPAKYILKMDDDAFIRIDEVLASLKEKSSNGLLYGHISYDSEPHRDKDSKWFVSVEEWPPSSYPPWAHGPGYIVSQDIARFIVQGQERKELMLFKLEDVAVCIWVELFKKNSGRKVDYVHDERFYNAGCESNYILAHYQSPRMILCLWEKLQEENKPECCE